MLQAARFVLALALAFPVAAAAEASDQVVTHGKTLKGSHGKIALVEAYAVKPTSLTTRVSTTPRQSVKLQWSVVCVKSTQTNSQGINPTATPKIGTTTINAPASFKLAMPFAHPANCRVAVYSTLSKAGKQTLVLLQG